MHQTPYGWFSVLSAAALYRPRNSPLCTRAANFPLLIVVVIGKRNCTRSFDTFHCARMALSSDSAAAELRSTATCRIISSRSAVPSCAFGFLLFTFRKEELGPYKSTNRLLVSFALSVWRSFPHRWDHDQLMHARIVWVIRPQQAYAPKHWGRYYPSFFLFSDHPQRYCEHILFQLSL